MTDESVLTLAFMDKAPRAAAEEIQRLPLEEAVALMDTVPTRLCVPVVGLMIPWHAARLVASMTTARAAAVLRQLGFAESISIARLMAADKRDRVIDEMPTRHARRLKGALRYPQHQVGAWIDPEVPTLGAGHTVHDALRILRSADPASHVFLESREHERFVGLIPIREILRSEATAALDQLRMVHCAPLSNRASLASLAFDERWDEYLHLPVVGRRGNLLGGLSRKTLRHAIYEQHAAAGDGQRTMSHEILAALTVSAKGLLRLASQATSARAPTAVSGAADNVL